MILSEATDIANGLVADLRPYCERIEIAGSLRRKKHEVHDIELVVIPCRIAPQKVSSSFAAAVLKLGRILKGKPTGKYCQIRLPGSINLDLFMARKENWGFMYAIRTGSADLSRLILAGGWVKAGYNGDGGMLVNRKTGLTVNVYEEKDLFNLIGIPYREPEKREV